MNKDDEINLEEIYAAYYNNVLTYIAYKIFNRHDAEDLANDVFVKAELSKNKYNSKYSVEAWLISIAKNTVTDYLRKQKFRSFFSPHEREEVDSALTPEETAIFENEKESLYLAMKKLNKKEREILELKFYTDLKHKEIGSLLKTSESYVGVAVNRAINKLRKHMEV